MNSVEIHLLIDDLFDYVSGTVVDTAEAELEYEIFIKTELPILFNINEFLEEMYAI